MMGHCYLHDKLLETALGKYEYQKKKKTISENHQMYLNAVTSRNNVISVLIQLNQSINMLFMLVDLFNMTEISFFVYFLSMYLMRFLNL